MVASPGATPCSSGLGPLIFEAKSDQIKMNPKSKPNIRLRPLGSPYPIHVRINLKGQPTKIGLQGRRRGGNVASIQEIWRIDDEWWRNSISRLYYQVVLENGKIMTLYRDLTDGCWYTH